MEEILERQLLIRGRAFPTISTIEKALAGLKKAFAGRMRPAGPMLCRSALECHEWSAAPFSAASPGSRDYSTFVVNAVLATSQWNQ